VSPAQVVPVAVAPPLLLEALADRYTVERELGHGGMATVYLAQDRKHQRSVALKVLRPEIAAFTHDRFEREIRFAGRLQHPHILPVLDSGQAAGQLWYTMPYVAGESLRQRLARETQLSLPDALQLTREVAEALDYAHGQGIIHRDIKPENILLSQGHALVADFGIARALEALGEEKLTATGVAVGTPSYMSPEQASGTDTLDGRADLYSLGCVCYELLAGGPPFTGASAQAIAARHAVEPVPPLRVVRSTIPEGVEAALTKVLAKVPADRYATGAEFVTALEQGLTARPRRTVLWTGAVIGVAVAAVVAGVLIKHRLTPPPMVVPGRVVVAPLEVPRGDTVLTAFREQWLTALPDAIAREGVGEPVPAAMVRDLVARARGTPEEIGARLARETGAGIEVRGSCARAAAGTSCQVDVLRMPTKVLRMSVSVTGDPAEPSFAAGLTERVLVALLLQKSYGDRVTWLGQYLPRSLAAVRAYEQAWDLWLGGAGDSAGDKPIREAARLDTGWVLAALWVARSDSVQVQRLAERPGLLPYDRDAIAFSMSQSPERRFDLARRLAAVNPELWSQDAAWEALATNRPTTVLALSAYADSAVWMRGRWQMIAYNTRGIALHQLGRYAEELDLAHQLERQFPGDLTGRTHEVMALAALGEVDSLRRRLAEWEAAPVPKERGWADTRTNVAGQELMAHGHEQEGRRLLEATLPFYRRRGQGVDLLFILIWTDHLQEARTRALAFLATARSRDDSAYVFTNLGTIAARQGHAAEAGQYDRRLAALPKGAPAERAIIASALGDREGAVRFLEEARSGGDPTGLVLYHIAHRLPDFAPLRGYPPFEAFLKPRD
jgi:tetratricopeptide (TPR) repeat protein